MEAELTQALEHSAEPSASSGNAATETVSFVRSPGIRPFANGVRDVRFRLLFALPAAVVVLVVAAQFGRVAELGVVVLLAVSLFAWRFSLRAPRATARAAVEEPVPHRDDEESPRLRCIAHPMDIAHLDGVSDVAFEPIIVYQAIPTSSEFYQRAITWGFGAICAVCAILHTAAWIPFAALAVVPWIFRGLQSLRPRCYRIVPGRLDVLQFTFWRDKGTTVETLDLRIAEVTCNLKSRMLEIRSAGPDSPPRRFDLLTMADPLAFVRGIFQAALCKAVPGNLPRGELLG
jgi:hypothetical protein